MIVIRAGVTPFYNYVSGIYTTTDASYDHQVSAVGYGTTALGEDYFILKNSWGTGWGEQGFIRMAPGAANMYYRIDQIAVNP